MKTYIDCIPCFIRQALEAARMVTDDDATHAKVVKEVMKYLESADFTSSPPYVSTEVHRIIRDITGSEDPYKDVKYRSNEHAMALYPKLKSIVDAADDRLLTAVKLAIAGNVIDFGTTIRFDVEDTIKKVLITGFAIDNYREFKQSVSNANSILYLGDNAGEIVFDRILVEELADAHDIIFAVKPSPIINDATIIDAISVGLDKYAKIISIGTPSPGAVLELCSSDFVKQYKASDVIIAKGQGNYEALPLAPNLFVLLTVKCALVARDLGVEVGDLVLYRSSR